MTWNPDKTRLNIHRNLTAITEMCERLAHEAETQGDPTSEAVMLDTPAGNREAWEHQYATLANATYQTNGQRDRALAYAQDQTGETHPLLVLATWGDAIRDERGQPSDLKATISRAADYLRESIDWCLTSNDDGDLNFIAIDQLEADLRKVRAHLENILKDGYRPDLGVPCMDCGTSLIKDWGPTPEQDTWQCWPCGTDSTHDQYMLAVQADYLANAEWLTADQLETQWRIPRSTLKSWARRGHVQKRTDPNTGRRVYHVQQSLTKRDTAEST